MKRNLTPTAAHLISNSHQEFSAQERQDDINDERFVCSPQTTLTLEDMAQLLSASVPQNLLLTGESGSGKTQLVQHFIQAYAPPRDDPKEPSAVIPALYVRVHRAGDDNGLRRCIFEAMLASPEPASSQARQIQTIRKLLTRLGIRLLVMDPVGQSWPDGQLRAALQLGKTLETAVIATGTPRERVQFSGQVKTLSLTPWAYGPAFRDFLAQIESDLPLLRPSGMNAPALSAQIHQASSGHSGRATALIRRAALKAVGTTEYIAAEGIRDASLTPVKA